MFNSYSGVPSCTFESWLNENYLMHVLRCFDDCLLISVALSHLSKKMEFPVIMLLAIEIESSPNGHRDKRYIFLLLQNQEFIKSQ